MSLGTATFVEMRECGALGSIPVVSIDASKPHFRNNGYNCFSGQPKFTCDALGEALAPQSVMPQYPQGHILIEYRNGQFQCYTNMDSKGFFSAW